LHPADPQPGLTRAALGGKASTLLRLTEDGLHVAERNAAAHTEGSGDGDH
jgi:hypothetical protein